MENYLNIQLNNISKELSEIENELSSLPEGDLKVYPPTGQYKRYYQVFKHSRTYLGQKDSKIIKQLQRKKSLELKRDYLIDQHYGIKAYKEIISQSERKYFDFISKEKLSEKLDHDCDISSWLQSNENSNKNYTNQQTYNCPSGNLVRSKSEVFIDIVLNECGIPYKYETELIIGNQVYYPDFTILHPISKKIIYWEHFGLMDEKEYNRKALNKLNFYSQHNIIPGKNLIITFETKTNPFSYDAAKAALVQMNL